MGKRPLLTLKKRKRYDDGGGVEGRDIDTATVDKDFSVDNTLGGFVGSPEIGFGRIDPSNPNNSSGLNSALDALAGDRTIGGRVADALLGERQLSFDPVTGEFAPERDWAGLAGRTAVSQMFGPLGPVVSLGMRAGERWGTPIDNERVGRGGEHGAGNAGGGPPVPAAGGGLPPQVAALIQQAMQARVGSAGGAGGPMPPGGAPPAPPGPMAFIPDVQEIIRRYGGAGPEAIEHAALAHGGSPSRTRSGLLRGPGTGRSDDIPADLEPDGFVLRADYVKDKGDGSPERGARRLAAELDSPEIAEVVPTIAGGSVPARVSNGEVYLNRRDTAKAGGPSALEAAQGTPKRRRRGRR